MEEYTAENALELAKKFGKISIPVNKDELFASKYNQFYDPSGKGYDFVYAAWKSSLEIFPFDSPEYAQADMAFQENIINSGIAEKLRQGTPLSDLVKDSKFNLSS